MADVLRSIRYGNERIEFSIRFMPRPLRRVAIHVWPDGKVKVDAPASAAPSEVVKAVHQRARWIWQQLQAQHERRRHVLPREYVSGESHFYLGRRHVLKLLVEQDAAPSVRLLRGRFEVTVDSPSPEVVRDLLDAWYRERARDVFARSLAEQSPRLPWLREVPSIRLQTMRTRWGSCSPGGELRLNPQLVKAPRACVDYVMCHELCHLKEHHHGPAFYRLLQSVLPDWQERKRELDDLAELLLNR